MEHQNGIIRGYMVSYDVVGSSETRWNLTTNRTSADLSGLMIFASYVVKVRAFTDVGYGPYSNEVSNKTLESCKYVLQCDKFHIILFRILNIFETSKALYQLRYFSRTPEVFINPCFLTNTRCFVVSRVIFTLT